MQHLPTKVPAQFQERPPRRPVLSSPQKVDFCLIVAICTGLVQSKHALRPGCRLCGALSLLYTRESMKFSRCSTFLAFIPEPCYRHNRKTLY